MSRILPPTLHVVLGLLLLGGPACNRLDSPSGPPIAVSDLTNIAFDQVGYTTYSVRHSPDSAFTSRDIVSISVGLVDDGDFVVQDSLTSVLDESSDLFCIHFSSIISFSSSVPSISLRVRYMRSDGTWTDIDTTLSTFAFPYRSTEILWDTRQYNVEDIDISGSRIVGLENNRIVFFDIATGEVTSRNVPCYEVLTIVDDRYVYYDHIDWSLYRYDLVADTSILFVPHPKDWSYLDMGVEVQGDAIWELLHVSSATILFKYSISSGELLDSIPIPSRVSRMTICDNVVFMETYDGTDEIRRFDLASRSFLPPLPSPTVGGEGIRIRDGYLYFSSFRKKAVGRVPLSDFLSSGLRPLSTQ